MDNQLKQFSAMGSEENWRTQGFRQSVVSKIEQVIQQSGMQVARNSSEMENHVFMKAKTREEYMNMVAKLILHVREMSQQPKQNQGGPNMQGPNQSQGGPNQQVSNQPGQSQSGPNSQSGMAPDPINALQSPKEPAPNGLPEIPTNSGLLVGKPRMGTLPSVAVKPSRVKIIKTPATRNRSARRPMLRRTYLDRLLKAREERNQILKNLASQGSRNQMMNMGPQGQMQQQLGPNPGMGLQGQMGQQGPIVSQGPQAQTATNLLQTLNQRPQLNMQMPNKLGGGMGMVPNQGQMGPMGGQMGGMGGPMGSQLQSQLAGPMQGQMMPNMSMPSSMQGPMSGSNTMGGQMPCSQGGMGGMAPNQMQQQMGPGQMGMGNSQMMSMLHMQQRVQNKPDVSMLGGGYPPNRAPQPFLRQSPSPSAPSPMGGPSPVSMGGMGGAMSSPMSSLGGLGCGAVGSPSPSGPSHLSHHAQHQQRGVSMSMVASPSSTNLNTPVGAGGGLSGVASPGGEDAAYREKVRQLSKYIEPLRRMVHRMVSEGENVEKLTKMKNLLDILSNPNKRMPLETLIKCEVVLEKLDFKRSEGVGLGLPTAGKEQIFNPLLEVVNNCLQSPLANHTLKRTFGATLDAINGPELKNLPPPMKVAKIEEAPMEIPDVLQGEIARLDSRFKVSLESMQLSGGVGAISLVAQLDDARLPCVPCVHVSVPRDYPNAAPRRLTTKHARTDAPQAFLQRVERAMDARCARLPKSCSVGQLLDAWEMSVRQACAPNPMAYTPVPALGL